jgi:hypothetical protein
MWKIPIGFGNCSASYLYIAGASIFGLIQDYLLSLSDIKKKYEYNIFGIKTVLKSHKLIRVLYGYISYILFGFLFFFISLKKKAREENEEDKDKKKEKISLNPKLHNKLIVGNLSFSKTTLYELLFVTGLFTLIKVVRKIIAFYKVNDLDFWIFNIVFVSIYMHKYFGNKMYKHQKYSLYLIFCSNICLLFIAAGFSKDGKSKTIYQEHTWECIFIVLTYIILSWISSATKVATKKLMDFNYISPYRIIFFIGIFGSVFTLISLLFTSNIKCSNTSPYCKIKDTTNNRKYLDSLPLYFSELSNVHKNGNNKAFYLEIFLVTPLYLFFYFLEFACQILIILYLNPNYILIGDCLYYGTTKLIGYTIRGEYTKEKFCVEYIAEMLALMGYTVYLEIVELKFCGLDEDLKKNIIKRSIRETLMKDIDMNLLDNLSDDEDDDVDERKKSLSETPTPILK